MVTGTGVVSALGVEVDTFYNALLEGRSGVSRIEVRDGWADSLGMCAVVASRSVRTDA